MAMQIYESAEDYLEAILILQEKKGTVHSVDIADHLHFSKASVSVAMKKLLAPGREIAERIYERHRVLTGLFVRLGVDEETAAKDACKVEHDLSEITFAKLKEEYEKTNAS